MQYVCITKEEWDNAINQLLLSFTIFASIENEFGLDYELIKPENISSISYNKPKPATSLKNFFLHFKENVTSGKLPEKPGIIIGIPNCDIEGLALLDEIYLDSEYIDIFYRNCRDNTLLISADCLGIQQHCHCLTYNIKPYSTKISDLTIVNLDGLIFLGIISPKGNDFVSRITGMTPVNESDILNSIENEHLKTEDLLLTSNTGLPGYKETGELVSNALKKSWEKFSSRCVSCGACAAICPTCSCFLLIDKPGFEKVKQLDTCQYPGFERVAGGEDGLFELQGRFRNRYMCKYSLKPLKFRSLACTGCGRCIEACIGKINKNEIFIELIQSL